MKDARVYKFISSTQIYRSCTSTFYSKTKCHQDMFYIHYCFKSCEVHSFLQLFIFFLLEKSHAHFWIKCHPLMN